MIKPIESPQIVLGADFARGNDSLAVALVFINRGEFMPFFGRRQLRNGLPIWPQHGPIRGDVAHIHQPQQFRIGRGDIEIAIISANKILGAQQRQQPFRIGAHGSSMSINPSIWFERGNARGMRFRIGAINRNRIQNQPEHAIRGFIARLK